MLHRPRRTGPVIGKVAGWLPAGFVAAALTSALPTPALAADPTGDWRVADGVANIRVSQCNGSMWGVVAWEKEAGGRDTNNPDPNKRSRPTLAMPILLDMKKKPNEDVWEGEVYNAKDGKTYSSTITPKGSDELEIRGCVLGFLCGGETWTRVGPPIPSGPANSMAKSMAKSGGRTVGAAGRNVAAAPKAAVSPATAPGQKAGGQADSVGDICLLPDIAGFAH